ncbi:hypothetical protein JYU34_006367 [Plutella xylostella]|uniref:Uncharacterized protein n=1 Tax=Plutella xylostella TaxID=51655 RepID=A0ABQ7QRU0_PLUXY|nr:hypothetical protein JYU34_006367 [Plutella xylostella]
MTLNIKKCLVISFSNKKQKYLYNYELSGHTLERKSNVKDLGIIFDDQLTFRTHYQYITTRANKLLGFIIRQSQDFKKPSSLLNLYYTLVRSLLEYGSCIWSPFYEVHRKSIERVQKKCLKVISYRSGFNRTLYSYEQRLQKFKVTKLETRRKQQDLIYLYKIIHAYIDSPSLLSFLNINISCRTRNYAPFMLRSYINNTSFYNPLVRMCRTYNELVVKNTQIDIFNPRIHKFKADLTRNLS